MRLNSNKYYIRTYGCQMNQRDTETIKGILEDSGYIETTNYKDSNLIIINTCAIRENAHNKVFGMLGRIKKLKQVNPNLIVGLGGCMPQQKSIINLILKKYKWLDFIFGTFNLHNLKKILLATIKSKKIIIEVINKEQKIIENNLVKRDSKYKASVNIMYGCNNFCTYCIVPYTRGRERSRDPKDIITEIEFLIKEGYLEVTLLGQNVNSYGKDFTDINYNIVDLLNDISSTNIKRIRFMTSNPWDFNEEMIDTINQNKNIMPHIHLPFQSGSDKILKEMNRNYTKKSYIELYQKIKRNILNVSITTDIIVGFPNETKEDFKETLDIVNKCKFDNAFTFIYSLREGTFASKIKDNLSLLEKKERLKELNELISHYAIESNKRLLNSVLPVLIEGYSKKDKSILKGYTENYKLVIIKANNSYIGKIVDVKIINIKTWYLIGEINNGKKS